MKTLKKAWHVARESVKAFFKDDAMSLAAAVAFYTSLSFAPLVMLLVTVGGLVSDGTQHDLVRFLNQQLGPRAGEVTEAVVENVESRQDRGTLRWLASMGILLFTASAVFGQLQSSLNRIWGASAKPTRAWWDWLRRRLLSMGMVLAILFILLVALVISAVLERIVPRDSALAARLGVEFVSFLVATLLFASMFKVLPDVEIAWREVWLGAAITAALFVVGKWGLSLYMEHGRVGEDYGSAAGALIALLIWVYYSCIILFVGAEVTQAVANLGGKERALKPGAEARETIENDKAAAKAEPA